MNIRGKYFEIPVESITKIPGTLLYDVVAGYLKEDYSVIELKYDRNPAIFDSIYDFYLDGQLHLPQNVCVTLFEKEMEFWRIKPDFLSPCCLEVYKKKKTRDLLISNIKKEWLSKYSLNYHDDKPKGGCARELKKKLWLIVEMPKSSTLAKVSISFSSCQVQCQWAFTRRV